MRELLVLFHLPDYTVGKERREDLVAAFRDIGKQGDRTGKNSRYTLGKLDEAVRTVRCQPVKSYLLRYQRGGSYRWPCKTPDIVTIRI